jgi:hypothetical protein
VDDAGVGIADQLLPVGQTEYQLVPRHRLHADTLQAGVRDLATERFDEFYFFGLGEGGQGNLGIVEATV